MIDASVGTDPIRIRSPRTSAEEEQAIQRLGNTINRIAVLTSSDATPIGDLKTDVACVAEGVRRMEELMNEAKQDALASLSELGSKVSEF